MIDLDRSCALNLRAMATGRPLRLVPPEAARQARAIQSQPKRWPFQWPNLVIELNRHETDYDPQGWLPAAEVPTVANVRRSFERGRSIRLSWLTRHEYQNHSFRLQRKYP